MSTYQTIKHGKMVPLESNPASFKEFKKEFNQIVGSGFGAVYQGINEMTVPVFSMRFEFDNTNGEPIVGPDAIGKMVYAHQLVLSQSTGITSPSSLVCFVMTTTPVPLENDGIKEEIFFQFPHIKISYESMQNQIVPQLKRVFEETRLHEQNMEFIPTNELDMIMSQRFTANKFWPMPGSYLEDSTLLEIKYIFDYLTIENVREGKIIAYSPETYLSSFEIPDKAEYDSTNAFFYMDVDGPVFVERKRTQREKNRDMGARLIEERQKEVKRTSIELCTIFVDMLSPTRYTNETYRRKLGQVLFNILMREGDESGRQGLELWKASIDRNLKTHNDGFPSAESLAEQLGVSVEQYMAAQAMMPERTPMRMSDEDLAQTIEAILASCEEEWDYFEYTELGIGSLKFWAKEDNEVQYKAFHQKDIMTLAWKCLNKTSSHTDAARLVLAKYSDQVVCANVLNNVWFGYWNHRWQELNKCSYLRAKISDEMPSLFEKILNECNAEYKKAISDDDKEKWSFYSNTCTRMIRDLKTVPYKNNLITECAEKFYDPDFIGKLDEDRNLIGVANGVFELESGLFRAGKPEDFISLSCAVKFNPNYNWNHPRVKMVQEYMATVYTDPVLRHYVQKIFGTILEGGNMNKDFYNMVGEGNNSKSVIAKLLKLTLGKYVSKVPVAMIMGKRGNADNATPHLADKKGIRALFVEEPPKGESNVSVVKELTGNDDVLTRALFKMPVIFSPQWKLFVFTNHLLEAPAQEIAYWNRQKVIDHDSLFSLNAPADPDMQRETRTFPLDPKFDSKLKEMAEPFLWCMIQWYGDFKREGLVPPARVLTATNLAKLRNDLYLQYINARIDQSDANGSETLDRLYDDFKTWCINSVGRKNPPTKQDFEDEMSKPGHFGRRPIDGHTWVGVKTKQAVTNLNVAMGGFGMAAGFGQQPPQQRLITATGQPQQQHPMAHGMNAMPAH